MVKRKTVEGQAPDFAFVYLYFFTVTYEGLAEISDTFPSREIKQAVLFINLLGKGLTQEISGE